MADSRQPIPSPDAGGAGGSSPSSSPALGPSGAGAVRPATDLSDLDADLDGIAWTVNRRGPRCTVGVLLNELPEATRERITALLATPRPDGSFVSAPVISGVLNKHGYNVRPDRLAFHRRGVLGKPGGCACGRD